MLETFDAVPGNVACVRRNRSNTPLQALTMLNEPLSMECARGLADVTMREGGPSDRDRLTYAFRRCVSRTPSEDELATLEGLLKQQIERLSHGEADALAIVGATSTSDTDDVQTLNERAAWTLVARVLLNLDETITKE
jgi:hypothetical protein